MRIQAGSWIHNVFQQPDGGCIGYDGASIRKYPGLTFQACIVWLKTRQASYKDTGYRWIVSSGLWQSTPDGNGVKGGFIDWMEISPRYRAAAEYWQRFIDTSFYAIAVLTGGYSF